jgi:thiosulfate/3-mercaptopyruvate sulfurtransferase
LSINGAQEQQIMSDYAHPEVLVTTDWVAEHKDDAGIKLVEVDVDSQAFAAGHIPGAIGFNWQTQLQDQLTRDILSKAGLESLLGDAGISETDTIVLYGDNHNWFAAYGFWLFKIYGHQNVVLMDGGRNKWLNEDDKALTTDTTTTTPVKYTAGEADLTLRSGVSEVLAVVNAGSHNLVDVRSPDEFTGKVIAPPGMSETAQRGGHIPGARSIPWSKAVNEDSTFRSVEELTKVYTTDAGVKPGLDTIAYCRIGERSSHTWFALRYLLGLKNVTNYDGSWTEYGSMVGVPIEQGAPA